MYFRDRECWTEGGRVQGGGQGGYGSFGFCISAASNGRASERRGFAFILLKERKKTDNPREGWEDGTPPPHRDFKRRGERGVVR